MVAFTESKQEFACRAFVKVFCTFPPLLVPFGKGKIYVALLQLLHRAIIHDLKFMSRCIPNTSCLLPFVDSQQRVCTASCMADCCCQKIEIGHHTRPRRTWATACAQGLYHPSLDLKHMTNTWDTPRSHRSRFRVGYPHGVETSCHSRTATKGWDTQKHQ